MTTFKVERIVEVDTENVMKLLRRTFFIDEPLNKAIGLCEPDGCPELEDYCLKTLPGLSHKALDEDGNIVGVLINGVTPVAEDHELKILLENCKNPKFKKVLQILVLRDKEARIWEKYPQEKDMLEVKIAATAPEARNRGVMTILTHEAEKTAKENGIKLIRMDTSSAYSSSTAERLGFTCLYSKPYAEILLDGNPVILPDPPHVNDKVFVKQL
ncbi:arylalkylamine N-acetyltransferase 1-like [Leptidea sinapis]|uniref:arylalkylamine N-acetyltransferase 1-like n=1 Tax=Leptidea sinapis TaxID=189913 RepID=UPI0021C43BBB|nr:arylalkylamine N-acetyltransferase 1-like [Leptidea sinapis]XP_050677535.1 arylalkylamine N-acetyltransferase 1-like [Leptidea sinapis]